MTRCRCHAVLYIGRYTKCARAITQKYFPEIIRARTGNFDIYLISVGCISKLDSGELCSSVRPSVIHTHAHMCAAKTRRAPAQFNNCHLNQLCARACDKHSSRTQDKALLNGPRRSLSNLLAISISCKNKCS